MNRLTLEARSTNFQKTLQTLALFLKKRNISWEKCSLKDLEIFIKLWVRKRINTGQMKPYRVENFLYELIRVLEYKKHYLPHVIRRHIRNKTLQTVRPWFKKHRYQVKRANCFTNEVILEVMEWLWEQKSWKMKATAIVLALCFTTASRTNDALGLQIDDFKRISNMDGNFLVLGIRTGKNNPMGRHPEQLTFSIQSTNVIKLEEWIEKWLVYSNNTTYLFATPKWLEGDIQKPGLDTKIINYYLGKVSHQLGLKEKITAHSGRNSVLLELYRANVPDDAKRIFMRWRNNSDMPLYYRNLLLEESSVGAAYLLQRNQFNQVKMEE